ncbi:MAG: GGDEF domain-containing protein, partial [Ignavibacteria bacterium]
NEDYVNLIDKSSSLFNNYFFDNRLSSEIKKNQLFNDHNLYCVYSGIDNLYVLEETGLDSGEIEKIFVNEIKEQFNYYDMIFKISDNKYAIISNFTSDDKVFLEFEKIRRNISTKIHNIEGNEISFTVSFAIKKYQDFNMTKERFLSDLDKMLSLSRAEGGNLVKIS